MRAVPADHERFAEAIEAFLTGLSTRRGAEATREVRTYIMGSIALKYAVRVDDFTLQPSLRINVPGFRASVVTPLDVVIRENDIPDVAHYKGQAIAAILSVASGRPFVAPRDPYLVDKLELTDDQIMGLAVEYNFIAAGPGCLQIDISPVTESSLTERFSRLVSSLIHLDEDRLVAVLQAIRLQHLGLRTRRTDFDLGFSLLVAAIEAMAQVAIKREENIEVSYSNEEAFLKEVCERAGGSVHGWFKQKVRDQAKLKARFLTYIFRYAPVKEWYQADHPLQELVDYLGTISPDGQLPTWITEKRWSDIYPEDLSDEAIRKIAASTYDDRSGFLHTGSSSRHRRIMPLDRFFEGVTTFDEVRHSLTEHVLMTFDALSAIARIALMEYLDDALANSTGLTE